MMVVADEDNRTYNGVGGDENSKDNGDNICNNRRNNGDKNGSDGGGTEKKNADNYLDDSGLWDGN